MSGGTSLDTIRASMSLSPRPRSLRSAAMLAPTSSAVRCASVAIRQRARTSSPSKTPKTVCVFPMSAPINKLQTLLKLPHAAQVCSGQKLPDRAAPRNIQIGCEVREPFEVKRSQDARMRHDEVRPYYDLPTEEQNIYVCSTRRFLVGFASLAPQRRLDPLAEAQKLDRRRAVPDLDHAVQIIWLLLPHLDRRRLVHPRNPAHH